MVYCPLLHIVLHLLQIHPCNKIKPDISKNRRISGIIYNIMSNCSCLMLSVYLLCNNYSMAAVNKAYSDRINYIKTLYNRGNCHIAEILSVVLRDQMHKLSI